MIIGIQLNHEKDKGGNVYGNYKITDHEKIDQRKSEP